MFVAVACVTAKCGEEYWPGTACGVDSLVMPGSAWYSRGLRSFNSWPWKLMPSNASAFVHSSTDRNCTTTITVIVIIISSITTAVTTNMSTTTLPPSLSAVQYVMCTVYWHKHTEHTHTDNVGEVTENANMQLLSEYRFYRHSVIPWHFLGFSLQSATAGLCDTQAKLVS